MTRFVVVLAAAAAAVLYSTANARAEMLSNQSVPLSLASYVPCAAAGAGEEVDLSGRLHIAEAVTLDAAGGLHLSTQVNPQGVSGVGVTTGATYRGTGVTRSNFNVSPGLRVVQVNNFRLIGTAGAPTLSVHAVSVFVVNANGVVTASVEQVKVTCG